MGAPANRVVSSSFDSPVFICGSREVGRGRDGRRGEGRGGEYGVANGSFTIPQPAITEELLPHSENPYKAQPIHSAPPSVPHPLYPTHSAPPTVLHPLFPTHFGDVLLFFLVLKEVHFVQDHHHLTAGDFANHQTLQEERRGEEREGGREEREGEGGRGRKATKPCTYT